MAALALTHNPNPLLSILHRGIQSLFQAPSSLLDLLPPIILAVPKSKVSHSRKSMRSANKGLKEKFNIVTCQSCGRAKQAHHLCHYCYSEITRGFKTSARQQGAQAGPSSTSTSSRLANAGRSRSTAPIPRDGATPVQPGGIVTKWMRARAQLGKEDKKVRLGKDGQTFVLAEKGTKETRKRDGEDDSDGPSSSGGASLPGLQLA